MADDIIRCRADDDAAGEVPAGSLDSARTSAIPDGWRCRRLGEIFEFKNGLNAEKSQYGSGVKFANVMDVFRGPRLTQAEIVGSMQTTERQLREYRLTYGDVLFNRTSETDDEIAQSSVYLDNAPAVFGGFVIRARPVDGSLAAEFSAYAFQSDAMRRALVRLGQGAIRSNIGQSDLATVPILLPPLSEQRRIAEVLSTWDRAISLVDGLIANARSQNRALMQSLLTGKRRLPGFGGSWTHQAIGEISTRVTRRNDGTELPVLTISSTAGFVRQDAKYRRFMAGRSVENYIVLRRGEFAYNKGNSKTYQFGCVFDLSEFDSGLVPHVYVCFKLKEGYSHRFYKALFEADYLAAQLGRLVNTGVRNNGLLNITPAQFLGTSVPVPPIEEQDAIAAVMETASAKVRALGSQLAALRQEKAALMQQLLTGKRRVKLDQKEAA